MAGARRLHALPDVPTLEEMDVAGVDVVQRYGLRPPRSPVGKVLKKDVRAQLVPTQSAPEGTDMDPKALRGRYAIWGVGEAGMGQAVGAG